MTLFIKRIITLSLIVILVFIILNALQSSFNIDPIHYKKQYQKITSSKNDYDGIVIGTSHATHSIRPSILDKSGIRFYNFSLNGAKPEYYLKWYYKFVYHKKNKPKICLYAVDFFMFDNSWLWRNIEQDAEYFPKQLFYKELTKGNLNKTDLIINRIPLFKYREQIIHSLKLEKGNKDYDIKNFDRGYISYSTQFKESSFKPRLDHKIDAIQVKCFKLLIKQMQEDDIKIFFIVAPEYGININSYHQMESLKIIDSLAKKFKIPLMNYNIELRSFINKNINLFSDWGHMNHKGSEIFSEKLARDLKAQNNFFLYE